MSNYRSTIWSQWDAQEAKRVKRVRQDQAYISLNNLYLQVERGEVSLTIHTANQLRVLAGQAYDQDDIMRDYWQREFEALAGWFLI